MKVRIKILWKLQVKEIEVDGFKWDYKKRPQIFPTVGMSGKVRFLASFRRRDKFSVAWPTTGADQDKYSHWFEILSYAGRNYIITTL